jgi:hypothetical protein
MISSVAKPVPVVAKMGGNSNSAKRRSLEKARIQKLKSWHEDVKKIAKAELDFIASIFKEDTENEHSENRDWIRADEEDDDAPGDGKLVTKEP